MSSEQAIRAEMVALLRYANLTAIGRELGVSAQAVKNWADGRNTSAGRLAQIRRLYGLQGTTKEPPEPAWLEGLVREVRMNRAVIQAAMAGADPAFVTRVLDRLAALESQPTGSADEAPDPIDAAT